MRAAQTCECPPTYQRVDNFNENSDSDYRSELKIWNPSLSDTEKRVIHVEVYKNHKYVSMSVHSKDETSAYTAAAKIVERAEQDLTALKTRYPNAFDMRVMEDG